jgi:hypothetical protein
MASLRHVYHANIKQLCKLSGLQLCVPAARGPRPVRCIIDTCHLATGCGMLSYTSIGKQQTFQKRIVLSISYTSFNKTESCCAL